MTIHSREDNLITQLIFVILAGNVTIHYRGNDVMPQAILWFLPPLHMCSSYGVILTQI